MRAADTETTGLQLHHGCRPFYFSGCDTNGNLFSKEWEVDPFTRLPQIPVGDIEEIEDYLNEDSEGVCFQNIKFDLHALRYVGVRLPSWKKLHCTLTMMHALDNLEPHDLKGMSAKYLNYPIDDESSLIRAVMKSRRIAKKLGWQIANVDHPHFITANGDTKKVGVGSDYWLPRQLALFDGRQQQNLGKSWKPLLSNEEREYFKNVCSQYANNDAERTILIAMMALNELEKQELMDGYLLNMKAMRVAFKMEKKGLHVHRTILKKEIRRLSQRTEEEFDKVIEIGNSVLGVSNFNPNSRIQLQKVLYDNWNLPVLGHTPTGQPTTRFNDLLNLTFKQGIPRLAKRFLKALMTAEKFDKTLQFEKGIQRALLPGDVVRANIFVTGTDTTRMAVRDPALQTMPKDREESKDEDLSVKEFLDDLYYGELFPRKVFGPAPGRIWYAMDYDQLQLRIFAKISGEEKLQKAFSSGANIHEYTAQKLFYKLGQWKPGQEIDPIQKRVAKGVNFGYIFGIGEEKMNATAGIPGLMDVVQEIFPDAHGYMKDVQRVCRKTGYVTTSSGYRLYLDKSHKGVNYQVQGDEGIIVKHAMIDCDRYLSSQKTEGFVALQVHDELIFDLPRPEGLKDDQTEFTASQLPHIYELHQIMENAGKKLGIITPVKAEVVCTTYNKGISIKL